MVCHHKSFICHVCCLPYLFHLVITCYGGGTFALFVLVGMQRRHVQSSNEHYWLEFQTYLQVGFRSRNR